MIFLVFSDYFQVQTFRWFCLPSKLVICHVCIRATSRIKSSNWELHIRYRSQLPQKSQDQPQPLLLSQTSLDNLAAPPIQRRSSRASKAPDRLEISCGSKTHSQAVTGTDLCYICITAEYSCTVYSCGPGQQQQTPGRRAQFIRLKWYDIQYDCSRKRENDCWLLLHQYLAR